MALRSIISIDVDDSQFQKFHAMFNQYQEALKSTPDDWKNVNEGTKEAAKGTSALGASVAAAAYSLHKISLENSTISRAVTTQASAWHVMARDAGKFAQEIAGATRSLLQWGKLTGLISGILGLGGLFGIERLATSASNQRAQALSLGMKPGDAKAFETQLGGRGFDADSFLGNVNQGKRDITSEQFLGLRGLGIQTQGRDTASVAAETWLKLKDAVDKLPNANDPRFAPLAGARRLDKLMSLDELQHLQGLSRSEVQQTAADIQKDRNSMGFTDQTAKAWQDLRVKLTETGNALENLLIKKLVDLSEPIGRLSDAFMKTADNLLSRPEIKAWIEGLADAIKRFGDWISDPKFQDGVGKFVEGVGEIAKGLWELINDIVAAGKALSAWTDRIFGTGGATKDGKSPYDSDPSQPYEKSFDAKPEWTPGSLYKWWHGSEETPPPTGVQKQSFDRLEGAQGLPPGLLNAVFQTESGGGKNLYSPAGAVGPFQFTHGAWDQYGEGGSPLSFQDSAAASARYFHKLLNEFHGDVAKAAAGYNAGEGNVERAIARYGENWRRGLPKPEETIPYIDKVVRALGSRVPTNNGGGRDVNINVYNNTGGNAVVSSSQLAT